jgi:hypothetical protein
MKKLLFFLYFLLISTCVYSNDDMTLVCSGNKTTTYFSPINPNGELLKTEKLLQTYVFVDHKLQNKPGYICSFWRDQAIYCSSSNTTQRWITSSAININRYAGTVEDITFSGPPEVDIKHNKETQYSFDGTCAKGSQRF